MAPCEGSIPLRRDLVERRLASVHPDDDALVVALACLRPVLTATDVARARPCGTASPRLAGHALRYIDPALPAWIEVTARSAPRSRRKL